MLPVPYWMETGWPVAWCVADSLGSKRSWPTAGAEGVAGHSADPPQREGPRQNPREDSFSSRGHQHGQAPVPTSKGRFGPKMGQILVLWAISALAGGKELCFLLACWQPVLYRASTLLNDHLSSTWAKPCRGLSLHSSR